ncbi:MAG: RNA polymerase sigma factor [Planctomycetota bacterium]|jgi:RNA polymerase sigma-70 factor (ECF subfamily)
MPEINDQYLINRFLKGDNESLGILYDKYAPQLFGFIRSMAGESESEDILHDVFIQAASLLAGYEEKGKFKSWLFTIARSRSLDHLRKKKRRNIKYLNDNASEITAGDIETPLEQESRKELRMVIDNAVNQLPIIQREIFLLREEGELSFKEIAESLDIPLNTALSHMHRAAESLREILKDYIN